MEYIIRSRPTWIIEEKPITKQRRVGGVGERETGIEREKKREREG